MRICLIEQANSDQLLNMTWPLHGQDSPHPCVILAAPITFWKCNNRIPYNEAFIFASRLNF